MSRGDTQLWRHAEEIFGELENRPAEEREALLGSLCAGSPDLRRAVRSLLAADARGGSVPAPESAPAADAPALPGFRDLEPIGRGGMGRVFAAWRTAGGVAQRVALKLLERRDPELRRLFEREREILGRLDHPGIARYLDGGTSPAGYPFLVMEYVEGTPLTRYCDLGRLGLRRRLELLVEVCDAVHYAHRNLVVHRDLKPDHILVTEEGRPKLLDFGIAKDLRAAGRGDGRTTAGRFLSPDYASPEQIAGLPVTTATDLYTLGLLLYELATGRLPRRGGGGAEPVSWPESEAPSALLNGGEGALSLAAVAALRSTRPRGLRRALRGDLDAIALRCVHPLAEQRYSSAAQLGDDLRRYLAGRPVRARRRGLAARAMILLRRRPAVATAVALGSAACLGYGVLNYSHAQDLARERDEARVARQDAEDVARFLVDSFRLGDAVQRVDLLEGSGEVTVREAVEYGASRVSAAFADRPHLQSDLLVALAEIHINQGRSGEALGLLERALSVLGGLEPLPATKLAMALAAQGNAYSVDGRLDEAVGALREAAAISEAAMPPASLGQRSEIFASLGNALLHIHDYAASEEALNRASDLLDGETTEPSRQQAQILVDLGTLRWLQRDLEGADAALQEAIRSYEALAPEGHPGQAYAFQTLAFVQALREEKSAAQESVRRALALRRALQGEDHPETLVALAASGEIFYLTRDYPAAVEALTESADRTRALKGGTHTDLSLALHSLANALLEVGRVADAGAAVREALEISRPAWGDASHPVVSQKMTLGKILLLEGRPSAATVIAREALAFRRQHFGDDHRLTALSATLLARSLEAQGEIREALPLAQEAVAVLSRKQGGRVHYLAVARAVLGSCLADAGDLGAAEAHLREAVVALEAERGPEARETRDARRRLRRWEERSRAAAARQAPTTL